MGGVLDDFLNYSTPETPTPKRVGILDTLEQAVTQTPTAMKAMQADKPEDPSKVYLDDLVPTAAEYYTHKLNQATSDSNYLNPALDTTKPIVPMREQLRKAIAPTEEEGGKIGEQLQKVLPEEAYNLVDPLHVHPTELLAGSEKSIPRSIARETALFVGDLVTDPTTYLPFAKLPGPLSKAATGYFTAQMAKNAAQEGLGAFNSLGEEPLAETAGRVTRAILSAGGGYLGGRHLLEGEGPKRVEVPADTLAETGRDVVPENKLPAPKDIQPVATSTSVTETSQEAPTLSDKLNARADSALASLKARGERLQGQASGGLPDFIEGVGALKDIADYGVSKLGAGVVDFGNWSKEMVTKFGDKITPHLEALWEHAQGGEPPVEAAKIPGEYKSIPLPEKAVNDVPKLSFNESSLPPGQEVTPEVAKSITPQVPVASAPTPQESSISSEATLDRPLTPAQPPTPPPATPPTTKVEREVVKLKSAEGEADIPSKPLSRETPQTWKEDLDPKIKEINDPKSRQYLTTNDFHKIVEQRRLRPEEVQALAGRLQSKEEALNSANEAVKNLTSDSPQEAINAVNKDLITKRLDFITHSRLIRNDATGTARALAAQRRLMDAAPTNEPLGQFLHKLYKTFPNVTDKQVDRVVEAHMNNPEALPDIIRAIDNPKMLNKVLYAWTSGLVSAAGPKKFISDNAELVNRNLESFLAPAVDRLLSRISGPEKGEASARHISDAVAELQGNVQAFIPAMKIMFSRLWKETGIGLPVETPVDPTKGITYGINPIGGKLGRFVERGFKRIEIINDAMQKVGVAGEMNKQVRRVALTELGKSSVDAEVLKREGEIREALKDPASNPKYAGILAKVEVARPQMTFSEKPMKIVRDFNLFVEHNPIVEVAAPFTNTPSNLLRRAFERSPFGLFKAKSIIDAYKNGDITRAEAADKLARPLLGTILATGFIGLAKAGMLSGSGPTDPKENSAWRAAGNQPYSVVLPNPFGVGQFSISFKNFEPTATLLGMIADFHELGNDQKSGSELDKIVNSFGQNVVDKSWFTGLSDLGAAMHDPAHYLGKYVKDLGGSVVPSSVASVTRAIDPTFRDTNSSTQKGLAAIPEGIVNTILSRIPGASYSLPARRDSAGEDLMRPGANLGILGAASRLAGTPQVSATFSGQDVQNELRKVGYFPAQPSRDFRLPNGQHIRLSDSEYSQLQDSYKEAATNAHQVMHSASYQGMPNTIAEGGANSKEASLRKIYDTARMKARQRLYTTLRIKQKKQKGPKKPKILKAPSIPKVKTA